MAQKVFDLNGDFDAAAHNFDYSEDENEKQAWYKHNNDKLSQPDKFNNRKIKKDYLNDAEKESGKNLLGNNDKDDKNNKFSLREKEKNVQSDGSYADKYKNSVKGISNMANGNFKKAKANLKKSGPTLAIVGAMAGFVAMSTLSQMSAPLNFVSQLREDFDSISVSQNIRSKSFLKYQTTNLRNKNCIKAHYFRPDKFKLSSLQKSKLSKSNITVSSDNTTLFYHKPNGELVEIVADKKLKNDYNVTFDEFYESDTDFHNKYNNASRRWKNSFAAWYDTSMDKLLTKIGLKGRDQFKNFDTDSKDSDADMRKVVSDDADMDSLTAKTQSSEYDEPEEGGDGASTGSDSGVDTDQKNQDYDIEKNHKGDVEETKATRTEAEAGGSGIRSKLSNIAGSAIKASSLVTNFYCAFADGVGAITAAIAAAQMIQVINLASDIFEGIQKGQVGQESSSPYDEIGAALTKPVTNTYTDVKGLRPSDTNSNEYVPDENHTTTITRTRTALDADGVGRLYDGGTVNPDDPSVKSLNIQKVTGDIWKSMGNSTSLLGSIASSIGGAISKIKLSKDAFRSCTVARLGSAWLNLTMSVIDVAGTIGECIASRAACVMNIGKKIVKKIAAGIFKSLVVSAIVSFVISHVTNMLTRKVAVDVAGEDLGNALVDGGNLYMGKNHMYSGGSVASKESLVAYLQQQDIVIADNARYERETKSPFDASSKYTFLGSLMTQLIPLSSQFTSITGTIKGIGSTVGNAISSLMPNSSAVSAGIKAQAAADLTESANPNLADIGGVGDAFGNVYVITDTNTLGTDPADVVNQISDELEDVEDESADNVPAIKEDSNLARYIYYCGQRQSPFGMADQNIANEVDTIGNALSADEDSSKAAKVGSQVGQATLNSIDIIGDVLDIASNSDKLDNLGWITGQACVTGNEIEGEATKNWETAKYYQRFIEDQRLAETSGVIEKSSVTTLLAKYYEKHPVDNSFEGVIARYSGLTKDNVILAFNLLEVMDFVAHYNPTDMYPYPAEEEAEPAQIELEHQYYEFSNDAIALHDVVFDNNRYRNFAA